MDTIADIEAKRIPITVLTGFLGAGKTTLLNHVIKDPDAGNIAVIMNEFGSAGIDHDLIESSTEETILMQSGCLCCTFRGDISKTLGALMARRKRGELAFDRVVIETTGIADPAPIMNTLVVDELTAANYRIDGLVALADAAAGPDTLDMHAEAVSQIAIADLIVVTKSDLVSPDELSAFEVQLASINDIAHRVRADHGRVALSTLLDLSAMHQDVGSEDVSKWLGQDTGQTTAPQTDKPLPKPRHDHGITSASIEIPNRIPADVFDFWLDTLIALKGPDVLRMKGIVHVEGMHWPFVFHGVQHIFDEPVPLENWTGEDTISRVVVIARDMSKADLEASLETLHMRPKDLQQTDAQIRANSDPMSV